MILPPYVGNYAHACPFKPGSDRKMYYCMNSSKTGVPAIKAKQELEQSIAHANGNSALLQRISELEKQNADLTERLEALEEKMTTDKGDIEH